MGNWLFPPSPTNHDYSYRPQRAMDQQKTETEGNVKRIVESMESVSSADKARLEDIVSQAESRARAEQALRLRAEGL